MLLNVKTNNPCMSSRSLISSTGCNNLITEFKQQLTENLIDTKDYSKQLVCQDELQEIISKLGLTKENFNYDFIKEVLQQKVDMSNSDLAIDKYLRALGSYLTWNATGSKQTFKSPAYKSNLSAVHITGYFTGNTHSLTNFGEFEGVCGIGPNSLKVAFAYPNLVMQSLKEISTVETTTLRNLSNFQRNMGSNDVGTLSKTLLQGYSSKVEEKMLIPPILPVVKGLNTLMGNVMIKNISQSTAITLKDPINQYDYDGIDTHWHNNANQIIPTIGASFTVQANPIIQVVYWNWTDYLQFGLYSQNSSTDFYFASLIDFMNSNAVAFIPITRSMLGTGVDLLLYAMSFTGYNQGGTVLGNDNTSRLSSVSMYNAWGLPKGAFVSGQNSYFLFLFILMDSNNQHDYIFSDFDIGNNILQFAAPDELRVGGVPFTINMLQMLYITAPHLYVVEVLTKLKWLAGSMYDICLFHASTKFWELKHSYVYNQYIMTASGSVGMITPNTHKFKLRSRSTEHRVRLGGNWPIMNQYTSSLPYDVADSIFWCIGRDKTYFVTPTEPYRLVTLSHFISTVTFQRLNVSSIQSGINVDPFQIQDEYETPSYFGAVEKLYPLTKWYHKINTPKDIVYTLGGARQILFGMAYAVVPKAYVNPTGLFLNYNKLFTTDALDMKLEIKTNVGLLGKIFLLDTVKRVKWNSIGFLNTNTFDYFINDLSAAQEQFFYTYISVCRVNTKNAGFIIDDTGEENFAIPCPLYLRSTRNKVRLVFVGNSLPSKLKNDDEFHIQTINEYKIDDLGGTYSVDINLNL